MRLKNKITVAFITVALITLSLNSVQAQTKRGGVIKLEVTTIEGRVQKPNAFFINTRQSLVYKSMEIKENFVPKIIKVVDTGDF
ncbi:MAG: hypothetical protein JXR91_09800 [Deltaproteobacteria bacterium]|nr:hypothetical protein [Deltaproteobacteria bacterium]